MQYILTAEEMAALVPREELVKMAERVDKAELCLEAMNEAIQTMPVEAQGPLHKAAIELYKHKMAVYEGRKTNFNESVGITE